MKRGVKSVMGNVNSDSEVELNDEAFEKVSFPAETIPLDDEGYCQSFSIDQHVEYSEFFDKFGFVIINDIAPRDDCENLVDEIWNYFESRCWAYWTEYKDVMVDRNDSTTWKNETFPFSEVGIVGSDVAQMPTAWKLRQNEKMYKVFTKLYGITELWVSLDRVGAMRPTKQVPFGKLTPPVKNRYIATTDTEGVPVQDFPKWKTEKLWLHWDLNPWAWTQTSEGIDYLFDNFIEENNGSKNTGTRKMQGLITLVDSRNGDGGFCCVPGFSKHLHEYALQTKDTLFAHQRKHNYTFVHVHPNDPTTDQAQPISSRAGSLIIWNSETPHCNYPNDSNRWRFNLYVKMFPAQQGKFGTDRRKKFVEKFTQQVQLTPLGKKLLGLEDY